MPTSIEFNHVSKQYRLGLVSTKTLSHDLQRWWAMSIRGKEDPYLKIGETNDRATKGESDYVWALKDIDFKVEQGDVVGIIGKNGAGKSTLLKLLSKVTGPTTGSIKARGRIGALLEVGTGFHPEMTGRENIFLNGAILGMSKQEIAAKLDEIVDFSGCERYLDTPVKRYSSGMMVRLGFAVAAHLDPEILVVDEVLAVGDAEFQKKAIGKMQDVSKGEGRTVLFVSHNMSSVRQLCKSGLLLENGSIKFISNDINKVVDNYITGEINESCFAQFVEFNNESHLKLDYEGYHKAIEFVSAELLTRKSDEMASDDPIHVILTLKRNNNQINKCQCAIVLKDLLDIRFATIETNEITIPENQESFKVDILVPYSNLAAGTYKMQFEVGIHDFTTNTSNYDIVPNALKIRVTKALNVPEKLYVCWRDSYGHILFNPNLVQAKII